MWQSFLSWFAALRGIVPTVRQSVVWATVAVSLVGGFEGLATKAYPDKLAHGLPTVCYGMTKYDRPVKMGDHYTKAQCDEFLKQDLEKYNDGINKCVKVPMSDKRRAASVSLAYNIGVPTFCKSTYVRRLNHGDAGLSAKYLKYYPNVCDSILAYNEASGIVVNGLVRRRQAERKLCME